MGTFDSIYLNKIKQLQEENRQLRHALQEAGIEGILRPLFGGGAVQSAAKALRKKKPTQTTQPPSQPPSPKPTRFGGPGGGPNAFSDPNWKPEDPYPRDNVFEP